MLSDVWWSAGKRQHTARNTNCACDVVADGYIYKYICTPRWHFENANAVVAPESQSHISHFLYLYFPSSVYPIYNTLKIIFYMEINRSQ